jgi:HNH endonuclease
MTWRTALQRIAAYQAFRRVPLAPDGRPYGPGWFSNPKNWLTTLEHENRRVSVRLSRMATCVRCSTPLAPDSTGDHLIPRCRGGPDGAQNYLPLCGGCNASKGARDLLDWWIASAQPVSALPPDVLCAYARLMYTRCPLDAPAPPYVVVAVQALEASLAPPYRQAFDAITATTP